MHLVRIVLFLRASTSSASQLHAVVILVAAAHEGATVSVHAGLGEGAAQDDEPGETATQPHTSVRGARQSTR